MNDHSQIRAFEHKPSDDGSADGGGGLDLKEKIRILFRRKMLIITTVLLITSIIALISFSLPPRFVAVASILIEEGRTNVVDTQATGEAVIDESADSRALAAELNLLRSRTYAQAIVEELDLLMKPEFNPVLEGKIGPLEILAERFATLSDMMPESLLIETGLAELIKPAEAVATKEAMASLPPPGSEAYEDLMGYAIGAMLNRLQIKAAGSNLILIRAQSSDPEQAAQIADEVASLYVADQLEIKQDAVDQAIEWLGQRVTDLRNRVLTAEGSVVEFREEHGLLGVNTSRSDGGSSVLSDVASTRSERVAKEELLAWVKELRNQGAGLDTITAVLPLPSLAQLREKQRALEREEAILRQKFGGQHREIIQLDGGRHPINFEREHVSAQIGAELGAAIRKLEGELAFAKRREAESEVQPQPTPEVVTPDARAEVQLRDLERQAEADRSLYIAFLNRFQEVSEQRNLLKSTATVASRAGVPGEPEFPKPMLMIIGGFTLSLTLGTMLAFFAEYLDSSLRTGRQIERLLNLPTLAFVPKVSEVKRRGELHRYLIDNPRSAYAEAVRTVQIATLDAIDTGDPIDAETPGPVVLVTSSLPGEGKTTLALSLAASSACSGRKAVIVDLDLRRPRQHYEAGLGQGPGLVEVLEDDVDLDDVLYTDPGNANLDILPAGRLPNSPADLLCSPMMASLIAELRERYDYIVLDSPPLLGVIDAKLAARLADAVLFVTQWEKTKEAAAKSGIGNLLDRNTPPIGAVLTQVDVRRHAKRSYGESIQYYKKYEAYYDN
ncbi:MAG: GumC family protein [Geminicoccaceae bacterium]